MCTFTIKENWVLFIQKKLVHFRLKSGYIFCSISSSFQNLRSFLISQHLGNSTDVRLVTWFFTLITSTGFRLIMLLTRVPMYSSASNSLDMTSNLNFAASLLCNRQTPHFSSITRNRLAGIIEREKVNGRSSDKFIKICGAFRSLFKFKAIIPHMYMMWIDIILTFITWKFVRTTDFTHFAIIRCEIEFVS